MSTHQRLLTVHDLFLKAYSSASTQDHDLQQSSTLSFVGQVVRAIDSSRINLLETEQDQELKEYPLHPEALSAFKAHGDGSLPDLIVWLGQPHATGYVHIPEALVSRNNITVDPKPTKQDHVVVILDSDEEDEQETPSPIAEPSSWPGNIKQDDDDGTSSCVSWSDSNASPSEAEGESGASDQVEDVPPWTMVAVLLRSTSHRNGSSAAHPISQGDIVEVTKALMLQQELTLARVVTCVGIAGTLYRTSPALQDMRIRLFDEERPARKQSSPVVQLKSNKARKRSYSDAVSLDDDLDVHAVQTSESPKDKKRKRIGNQDINTSPVPLSGLWSHQATRPMEQDPLKFLVHSHGDKDVLDNPISCADAFSHIDYLSNVWCSLPIAPSSATFIPKTPSLSYISLSDGAVVSTTGGNTITRHICRINKIRRAQIRAVCAECNNDFRSYICPYGCGSRKWQVQVQLECTINDGTSVAELRLCSDQEDVMWTLLGLKESSRDRKHCDADMSTTITLAGRQKGKDTAVDDVDTECPLCASADPYRDLREKVLRIVARRGFLTFKSGPALDLATSTSAASRQSDKDEDGDKAGKHEVRTKGKSKDKVADAIVQENGYVETIDQDTTERAKTEEKLWLDICTVHPRKQQSFVLHAKKSSEAANNSTPTQAINSNRRAVLKKSWVQIQKWRTVETAIRPPLGLLAVAAEWIRPSSETRMLLNRLLRHSS
ncbi:hypothetical protein BGZ95_000553 [Linnemannia exigua]|uniref:Uncharacterized protein n=1 Tax=Linnemannia exigua TaxID=604196 RepID=A0AAD4H9X9_9FUNG|nr:hypothetical protein BGZ95_000553 [Linnemannia exigua]